MRHAVFVAPFGELADPRRMLGLAVAVEESGWDRPAPGARDGNDRAFPLPERARKLILARLPKFLDDEA